MESSTGDESRKIILPLTSREGTSSDNAVVEDGYHSELDPTLLTAAGQVMTMSAGRRLSESGPISTIDLPHPPAAANAVGSSTEVSRGHGHGQEVHVGETTSTGMPMTGRPPLAVLAAAAAAATTGGFIYTEGRQFPMDGRTAGLADDAPGSNSLKATGCSQGRTTYVTCPTPSPPQSLMQPRRNDGEVLRRAARPNTLALADPKRRPIQPVSALASRASTPCSSGQEDDSDGDSDYGDALKPDGTESACTGSLPVRQTARSSLINQRDRGRVRLINQHLDNLQRLIETSGYPMAALQEPTPCCVSGKHSTCFRSRPARSSSHSGRSSSNSSRKARTLVVSRCTTKVDTLRCIYHHIAFLKKQAAYLQSSLLALRNAPAVAPAAPTIQGDALSQQ